MTLPDGTPDADDFDTLDTADVYDDLVETSLAVSKVEGEIEALRNRRRALYVLLYERGETYAAIGRSVGQTRMAIKMQIERHLSKRTDG